MENEGRGKEIQLKSECQWGQVTMSRQGRQLIKIRRKGKEKMRAESDRGKSGTRSFIRTSCGIQCPGHSGVW